MPNRRPWEVPPDDPTLRELRPRIKHLFRKAVEAYWHGTPDYEHYCDLLAVACNDHEWASTSDYFSRMARSR
jgi:hypothetical protein